jgi:hypothetical protein
MLMGITRSGVVQCPIILCMSSCTASKHQKPSERWQQNETMLPKWYHRGASVSKVDIKQAIHPEPAKTVRKRALSFSQQLENAEAVERESQSKLHKAGFKNIDEVIEAFENAKKANIASHEANTKAHDELVRHVAELERRLEEEQTATKSKVALRFRDLDKGGRLEKYVPLYSFFNTYEENQLFLDAVNVKMNDEDPGTITRIVRQSLSDKKKRKKISKLPSVAGGINGGRYRNITYQDEWLIFSLYLHAGFTYKQIESLCSVTASTISDIVRSWATYLDEAFKHTFPNPTKSDILRSFPEQVLFTLGHARVVMVNAAVWSDYHNFTGIKFLAACTLLGVVPHSWIPDGQPASVSDINMTKVTNIIPKNLKFGDAVLLDKGFLIENLCAAYGVQVIRPVKSKKGKYQFSAVDAHFNACVAHARIVVEQVNGQAKAAARYLNTPVPLLQLDLVSKLTRIVFLMANFKPCFTVGVRKGRGAQRPCRFAVLYFGEKDEGVIDVRSMPELWATRSQLKLFNDLKRENPELNSTEIAERVLSK